MLCSRRVFLVATFRLGTNSWARSHGFGNSAEYCPFCDAPGGDRISHFVQCGGIFVWLDDTLPGIHWPLDDPGARITAFFGCIGCTPAQGAATAIVHDIIHSTAKSARMNAVSGRSALTARMRAVMSGSTAVLNILMDLDSHL